MVRPRVFQGVGQLAHLVRVSGLECPGSDFGFRVSDLGVWALGFGSRVSGLRFRISGFGFRIRVSGLRFRIRVPGFGFRVAGNMIHHIRA